MDDYERHAIETANPLAQMMIRPSVSVIYCKTPLARHAQMRAPCRRYTKRQGIVRGCIVGLLEGSRGEPFVLDYSMR
jgi:hypothetical protein